MFVGGNNVLEHSIRKDSYFIVGKSTQDMALYMAVCWRQGSSRWLAYAIVRHLRGQVVELNCHLGLGYSKIC